MPILAQPTYPILNYSALTKALTEDKEYLSKTLNMVLNSELYSPNLSNPQYPSAKDPLFFEFQPHIDSIQAKLQSGEVELAKYQDFVRILTECKLNLKELNCIFTQINTQRLEYRTWVVKILVKLVQWRNEGSFYSGVEALFKDISMDLPSKSGK